MPCPCRANFVPMPYPCRAHAVLMPCPCRANVVPMPCPYRTHAVLMPCPCRAHAVPLPCRTAKGWLIVSFPFDLHSAAVSDSHLHAMPMPCSDHAILLKATAQHVRLETACGLLARLRLLPSTTRSSTKVVIRSIPTSDAGGQCETKQRLSRTRKKVVAAHYKKKYIYMIC